MKKILFNLLRNQMGNAAYNFAKNNFAKGKQFQKLIDFISGF
jgi:hypothetical protein